MGYWDFKSVNFSDLLGKTLVSVDKGNDVIVFVDSENNTYHMKHFQDCCESVYIEDIVGDLQDLVGSPILLAEESSGEAEVIEYGDQQFTFYKLATRKGYVDIRWNGSSNGYYSTSVSFVQVDKEV